MTKYENDCAILIQAEMQHGIAEHGLFHSPHEGLAVIMEEFEELQDAAEEVEESFQTLKWSVFADDLKTSIEDAKNIAANAKHAMIEAMQVAAMARKYIKSFENNLDDKNYFREFIKNRDEVISTFAKNLRSLGGNQDDEM